MDTPTFTLSPVVSKVDVAGTTHYIKDQESRSKIINIASTLSNLEEAVGRLAAVEGIMTLAGRLDSSFSLSDGNSTPIVTLDKGEGTTEQHEAKHGEVVIDGNSHAEFIWIKTTPSSSANVGHWELLGDESLWLQKGDTVEFTPTTSTASLVIQGLNHKHSISTTPTTTPVTGGLIYTPNGSITLANTSTGDAIDITVTTDVDVITNLGTAITLPSISSTFTTTPTMSKVTSTGDVTVTLPTTTINRVIGVSTSTTSVINAAAFTVSASETLALASSSTTVVKTASASTETFTVIASPYSTTTAVTVTSTENFVLGLPGIQSKFYNGTSETTSVSLSITKGKVQSSGTVNIGATFGGTPVQFVIGETSPTTSVTYIVPGPTQTVTLTPVTI